MPSLPQSNICRTGATLIFVVISIIIIITTTAKKSRTVRRKNSVITDTYISTNRRQQHRYRYLQRNITKNETSHSDIMHHDNDDDDIKTDTILISFSILNTIFFVLPSTIRYALQKRRCLQQNPTNIDNDDGCICSFLQLQNAISTSNDVDTTSVFIICPGTTIEFIQPIDITSKRFLLTCGTSRFINTQPCQFTRRISTNDDIFINFLIGAPTNVTIEDITFFDGYSRNASSNNMNVVGDGNGGAIYMTGGYMTLQNVIFDSNIATNKGGALYINPNVNIPRPNSNRDTIVQIRSRTTFQNNMAFMGGADIYIVPVTTKFPISFFTPTINVECIPSTLLNRPKFCNYNNDPSSSSSSARSIVIENVTTVTDQSKFSNCFNTDLIETSC